MKVLLVPSMILILGVVLSLDYASKVTPITKQVILELVCDSTRLEAFFIDCKRGSLRGDESRKAKIHYTKKCRDDAKSLFCKERTFILYKRGNKVIKKLPCSGILKKEDLKLCREFNK